MPELNIALVSSGLLVGFIVGLTGVGGGSLMTPLLVFLFGHAPATAVGTDLFFASATKAVGTSVHHRQSSVDWRVMKLLCAGSLPAAALTLWWLSLRHSGSTHGAPALLLLGVLVLLTGVHTLLGLKPSARTSGGVDVGRRRPGLTVLAGALLGVMVALTSIGAGVLGIVMLRALYRDSLSTATLVGTDLAHAIPLTLLAGAGYLGMGHVDTHALVSLLAGSAPGVIAGSLLTGRISDRGLRPALGLILLVVGAKTVWSAAQPYWA